MFTRKLGAQQLSFIKVYHEFDFSEYSLSKPKESKNILSYDVRQLSIKIVIKISTHTKTFSPKNTRK